MRDGVGLEFRLGVEVEDLNIFEEQGFEVKVGVGDGFKIGEGVRVEESIEVGVGVRFEMGFEVGV